MEQWILCGGYWWLMSTGISDYHTWQIEYEHGQQKRIFVYQQFSKLGTKTWANNSMVARQNCVFRCGWWVMADEVHPKLMVCLRWFGWFSHWNINHLGDFFWVVFFLNIFLRTPWANQRKLVVANGSSRKICGSEHGTIDSIHGSKRAVFISRICLREMVAAMPPYMNI
jgi:hypothetical protein